MVSTSLWISLPSLSITSRLCLSILSSLCDMDLRLLLAALSTSLGVDDTEVTDDVVDIGVVTDDAKVAGV